MLNGSIACICINSQRSSQYHYVTFKKKIASTLLLLNYNIYIYIHTHTNTYNRADLTMKAWNPLLNNNPHTDVKTLTCEIVCIFWAEGAIKERSSAIIRPPQPFRYSSHLMAHTLKWSHSQSETNTGAPRERQTQSINNWPVLVWEEHDIGTANMIDAI